MQFSQNLGNKRIIFVIFLLCLLVNFYLWRLLTNYIQERSKLRFENSTEQIQSAIRTRMNAYEDVLLAGRGLYYASDTVSRNEWSTYTNSLNIEKRFPGMLGVGFAPKITKENKQQYIDTVRAEGFTNFTITPDGDRQEYFPITFIDPFNDINKRAFGFDMLSNDVRKQAMERARDTNMTTVSGKVTLIQETEANAPPGILMYVPVYAKGAKIDTEEERRQNLVGYVYSPFRVHELMNGIVSNEETSDVHFEIFEAPEYNDNTLLYDSNNVRHYNETKNKSQFTTLKILNFGDKKWYVFYDTTPKFAAEASLNQKYIFPVLGVLLSFLITGVLYLFANSRARAVSIAERMVSRLHESEEEYKTVVSNLQEGVILQDADGGVITYNENAKLILGLNSAEMEGTQENHTEWYVTREDGSPLPNDQHPFRIVQKTGEAQNNVVLGVHKNKGEFSWIRASAAPVFSNDGGKKKLIKIVTSLRDITVQKKAEDELRNSNEQLSRSNAELQDFAYVASHDLQEPLRKITSFSNLLEQNYKEILPDQGKQFIDIIQRASKRMSKLITDLLEYSRVTTQAQPFVDVDLNHTINIVLEDLQLLIDESHAKIIVSKLCHIEGDELQIQLLFQNLISNAIKYARKNIPPRIMIYSEISNQECTVFVKDNGIGFDEKYLEKIFTIFQRLHGKTEYEGTGIGLAICKKIVERHNGIITAKSEIDKGSTFIIKLPLKQ